MLKTEVAGSKAHLNKIVAGSLIDVEILMPATSKRVKTEFVGLLEGQFIVLNHPNPKRLGAALDYIKEGAQVIVRALLEQSGGQIIAFKAHIKSVTVHPARLIFIHFPESVQLIKLRNHTRIPTLIPATFCIPNYNTLGVIKDISLKGLQLHVQEPHVPEDLKETLCSIKLTGKDEEHITLQGQVCSIKQESVTTHLGIKLLCEQSKIENVLKDYLIDLSVIELTEVV
ncbi:flagellar brake domain-containing protein [Pseudoalteromonas xiamenensis]|uniref:Flagellar brake protein n=1 Tax=Pseudoalteromonas xiamenensis TaxID=882626 RepID=A0A975HLU3_9GAMM|nr:flagellar brake protein [Pseudoalteromonas xiamenensis]QTH70390.1 flagellar brake protein [Pseudoalteromonas xiamenensis]